MAVTEFFTGLFSEVWRLLQLPMPYFNIPIWSVWVGVFLIETSISIFRNFLGITTSTIAGQEISRWYNSKPYERKVNETGIDKPNWR